MPRQHKYERARRFRIAHPVHGAATPRRSCPIRGGAEQNIGLLQFAAQRLVARARGEARVQQSAERRGRLGRDAGADQRAREAVQRQVERVRCPGEVEARASVSFLFPKEHECGQFAADDFGTVVSGGAVPLEVLERPIPCRPQRVLCALRALGVERRAARCAAHRLQELRHGEHHFVVEIERGEPRARLALDVAHFDGAALQRQHALQEGEHAREALLYAGILLRRFAPEADDGRARERFHRLHGGANQHSAAVFGRRAVLLLAQRIDHDAAVVEERGASRREQLVADVDDAAQLRAFADANHPHLATRLVAVDHHLQRRLGDVHVERAAAAAVTEGPHCFRLRFAVVRLGVRVAGEEKCGNVRVADQRAEISSEPRVRMFGDQAVRRVHRHIERDDVTVDGVHRLQQEVAQGREEHGHEIVLWRRGRNSGAGVGRECVSGALQHARRNKTTTRSNTLSR